MEREGGVGKGCCGVKPPEYCGTEPPGGFWKGNIGGCPTVPLGLFSVPAIGWSCEVGAI